MKAEERIYKAYLDLKKDKLYFNQLKEKTGLSNSSLQNALNKLIKEKTLKIEKTKSNTFYKIKNKKVFSIKFSEIAHKKFEKLNIEIKSPLRNFVNRLPKNIFTVVFFGSASKGEEQKNSDIDLLVVSNKKENLESLKREINNISNYPLSIFNCTTKQFEQAKDYVIIQAKKTGFPIYHEQNFYEEILDEYS